MGEFQALPRVQAIEGCEVKRLHINRLSKAMHKRRRMALLSQLKRELNELEQCVNQVMGMFEPVVVPPAGRMH